MRRHAPLTGLLVASALGAALPAGASAAGSYTVSACSPGTSPGAWQQVSGSPAGMSAGNQCGGPLIGPVGSGDPGALYAEDLAGSTIHNPNGAAAGWQFTAPTGTAITTASYYRALSTGLNLDWVAGLFDASGKQLDRCTSNPIPCSSPNTQIPVTLAGLNTSKLFFGVVCLPVSPDTSCLAGASQHYAQAQMYSVKVTLAEATAPSVTNIAGPLWSGGVVFGTTPLTFDASDLSGIAQLALDAPSGHVAVQPQSCDYTQTQPCPQLPSGNVSVDTTQLRDGTQTLTLLATNAAGNTLNVQSPPLVVDNNGPPAPATFTAAPIAGNARAVQLTWSDPLNPPQPVTGAYAQLCQATCTAAVPTSSSHSAQVAVPGPGTYGLRLWLTDSAGRGSPANAATTTVTLTALMNKPPSLPGPSGGRPRRLRLSYHLTGRALTVSVKLPTGATGPATITLRAYHGARRFASLRRRATTRHEVATVRLKLTTAELRATKLTLTASATDATNETIVLAHHRRT